MGIMAALIFASSSVRLLQMTSIALIAAVACSHLNDDARQIDFIAETEPLGRKGDDIIKRPFGGGAFSRGRPHEGRWTGPRSLTPWPMSKYVNRQEAKRSLQPPEIFDAADWLGPRNAIDKRPFGPGVYSRPKAYRTEKRPFGGSMIFSRPREGGNTQQNYRRYGYSRERRADDSPNDWSSALAVFRDGWHGQTDVSEPNPYGNSRAWLQMVKDFERSRSRSEHDGRIFDDDDDNDDDYDPGYNDEQGEKDEDEGGRHQSKTEPRKPEIPRPPFDEKRAN